MNINLRNLLLRSFIFREAGPLLTDAPASPDIDGENLAGIGLGNAPLRGSDLADVNLYQADLTGADLRGPICTAVIWQRQPFGMQG